MNIYNFLPIRLLVQAAYGIVTWLSQILEPLAGANGAALAVILLTITVRALLIPVGLSQVKASITRQRIAPKLKEIQSKHKKDPQVLQQKTMELYKEEKALPFAGCLPVLAQMPVLMAVYGIFIQTTIGGHPNELLTHTFLGVPLNTSLITLISTGELTLTSGIIYGVIVVVIAVVAQFSRSLLMPATPPGPAPSTQASASGDHPTMPDLTKVTHALSFMPFMTAVFAAFVPLAAAVYLMTTTTWTLCERLTINRLLDVHPNGMPRKSQDANNSDGESEQEQKAA